MFDEPIWGLDLGSTAVRVVRLARRGSGFEIVAVDRIDTYRDPLTTSAEDLDAALRKALSIFAVNHRIGARDRVGVAIPGLGFETAVLDLPPVARRRLPSLVDYEVRGRAGAASGEIVHAFRELPSPSVNERRVLVAMGSAGVVGGYLDAVRSVGLMPDRLTLAPLAFFDALRADGLEAREAVAVRAGVGATDIVLGLREGPITRTEPEGTLRISRFLREKLGLSAQEAEAERAALEARRGDPRSQPAAADYAARLADRVFSAVEFGKSRNPAFAPHRILLAGEGSRIAGVPEQMQRRFGLPVEVHQKWNRVRIGKHLFGHAITAEVPAFSVALGAAIDAAGSSGASLSLLPADRHREMARALPLLAASVLAFGAGVLAADRFVAAASVREAAIEQQLGSLRGKVAAARRLSGSIEDARLKRVDAERAWLAPAEWSAWERASGRILEALGPDAVVLESHLRRGEKEILAEATVAFPAAERRDFHAAVAEPLRAGGFPGAEALPPLGDAGLETFRFEVRVEVPDPSAGEERR